MPASIKKRYVALCDVLGFSDLVRSVTLDSLYARYEGLLTAVRAQCHLPVKRAAPNSPNDRGLEDVGLIELEHAFFSDTILIWSEAIPDGSPTAVGRMDPFGPGFVFFVVDRVSPCLHYLQLRR